VKRAVDAVAEKFGKIDYLILNAAVGANIDDPAAGKVIVCQSCTEFREEDFELVMNINLKGALRFVKFVVPYMPASIESAIVPITSEFADGKAPYAVAYTAAKAALSAVGTSLAYDEKVLPRRSVVLAPGPINAPMLHANPKAKDEVEKGTTLKRWAEPEEIAEVILTICHVPAFQGTVVQADCGFIMRK
jgi:NAD(P)-dependent dehydrogenase (short-subunit alcohol dehydrogenase family)